MQTNIVSINKTTRHPISLPEIDRDPTCPRCLAYLKHRSKVELARLGFDKNRSVYVECPGCLQPYILIISRPYRFYYEKLTCPDAHLLFK